ncbi:unnamed protein product [Miscanthus lutarioriparius]|uniref:MADS-box domain-containing protein n=1 Tax=Miscanthus lutarioriparius TaxID=422564 RepID=A0A811P3C0_9POAL|nr:unnamed protein product [Miscanthus lutarioriparius]
MARKKVNLQWITKASSRGATFRRRRDGIKKNVDELATLCGSKTEKVRTSLGEMVEEKTKKVKERIQQLRQLGIWQGKRAAPEPTLPLQLGSSSAQPLAPYTFNEIQTSLVLVVGHVPPQQQDWMASLTTNGGELGTIVSRAFAGSSGGVDMMHPYNMDYFSRFP